MIGVVAVAAATSAIVSAVIGRAGGGIRRRPNRGPWHYVVDSAGFTDRCSCVIGQNHLVDGRPWPLS